MMRFSRSSRSAFTLVEMLIVLGLVAVLSVVLIVTLNPSELLNQAKDSNRLNNLDQLHSAVKFYVYDNPAGNIGSSSVVYTSLVDPSTTSTAGSNCASLNLISLPGPWVYHCAASSTLRRTDGTGWVPINFAATPSGNNLDALPIDPLNDAAARYYYTYQTTGNSWEFDAKLKSIKYTSRSSVDGGDSSSLYERGSLLTVAPQSGALTDPLPYATTTAATSVVTSTATLNGTVNANGATSTAWFEYGTTPSFGSVTSNQTVSSSATSTSVSANLTGLVASSTYYFRIDASNSYGAVQGNTMSFTTLAGPLLAYSGTTSGSQNMATSPTLDLSTAGGSWTFTVNTAFTIRFTGYAGGGGGGAGYYAAPDGGGGGGGGASCTSGYTQSLSPGTTYQVTVGSGGGPGSAAVSNSPTDGGGGGATAFRILSGTVYVSLNGGNGGGNGKTSTAGGTGGSATGCGSIGGAGGDGRSAGVNGCQGNLGSGSPGGGNGGGACNGSTAGGYGGGGGGGYAGGGNAGDGLTGGQGDATITFVSMP